MARRVNQRTSLRRPGTPRAAFLRAGGRGFTLIELVIVMAIMAIIAAMAAPRYGRALARHRADAAARRIVADLALARQRARAMSQSVTVAFDWPQSRYTIAGLADPEGKAAAYTVSLREEPYLASIDVVDFAGAASITFNGFGRPSAGGQVSIASGSSTRVVQVDAKSGEASAP